MKRDTITFALRSLCGLTLLLQMISPSAAQFQLNPSEPGITVEGFGEAKTVPDVVEINVKLNARGELTDDAIVKHKDSRKRTLETFQALKLENLKLEEKELSLKPGNMQEMMQMMWNGTPPSQNKRTAIEVGSTLRARLIEIDKMPPEELMSTIGKLLDAAQDSGAGLGISDADMMNMRYYGYPRQQSSLVKFVVTNVGEIREKAYDLAVKDARRRAERLARLSGVTLGAVLAVDELSTGGGRQMPYNYNPYGESFEEDKTEITADTLSGGQFSVRLRVRFAIASSSDQADANGKGLAAPVAVQEESK